MTEQERLIEKTISFSKQYFAEESSGHDWFHTERVYRMALKIAMQEGADCNLVGVAALLHDVDDRKISPNTAETKSNTVRFLTQQQCSEAWIQKVVTIIDEVSFRGTDSVIPSTIEGKCVQDADRLDAIGAIGIARAFAFGGNHHRQMHNPDEAPTMGMDAETYYSASGTTINHFYEKLLLLKDMMNTRTAQEIAENRDAYMRNFLNQFFGEWNANK